jgi:peptidoglycan/LPS O-acetylase OafA/YrhL
MLAGSLQETKSKKNIDALTGLRIFAAISILYSHLHEFSGMPFAWMQNVVLLQGVSFFFVLSGFILSVNYAEEDAVALRRNFFVARFVRIYPVYVFGILLALLCKILTYGTDFLSMPIVRGSIVLELALLQSWLPYGYWPVNGPGWSISTEAFFYLVFPFVRFSHLRLLAAFAMGLATVVATILVGAHFGLSGGVDLDSYFRFLNPNPLIRLPEFLLGVWLGARFQKIQPVAQPSTPGVLLWTMMEAAALLLCYWTSSTIFRMWVDPAFPAGALSGVRTYLLGSGSALSFAVLIWIFAYQRGIASRLVGTRPVVFLGEISFALYLIHVPLLELPVVRVFFSNSDAMASEQRQLLIFGFIAGLLTLAALVHLVIEQPIRLALRALMRAKPRSMPRSTEGGGGFPWTKQVESLPQKP